MRLLTQAMFGLALAGLLATGVTLAEDKKDEKAKPEKKAEKPGLPFPDLDKLLEQFGGGLDEDQIKELKKQMDEVREQLKQLRGGGFPGGLPGIGGLQGLPGMRALASAQEARLGASLKEPSATLIDQLDLPKDQGLVLGDVGANSAAAKAGLKAHDVLLEVGGKAVPSKRAEFDKMLAGVEANKAVEVVVLRKGKKETVKGLTLPEAKAVLPQPGVLPGVLPRLGNLLGGDSTSVVRNNDDFTVKHTSGGTSYVVKGKVNQGKAEVGGVTITTDGASTSYDSLDKVPMEHQEKVKQLAEMSTGDKLRRKK